LLLPDSNSKSDVSDAGACRFERSDMYPSGWKPENEEGRMQNEEGRMKKEE